jgi:uncharacterized glyoxalase superfamily protein PhnB
MTNASDLFVSPDGYTAVTPFVCVKGAAGLLDFIVVAFDGVELGRVPNPDGTLGHAEIRIGDAIVMMFDAKPDWPDTPAFLRLYVRDCTTVFGKALEAGATLLTEPTLLPWGERVARVRDPFGNIWWMMERVEKLPPDEVARRFSDPAFQTAMAYVQGVDFFAGRTANEG